MEATYYVAECIEFPTMGEFHEGITDVNEAIRLWENIPPERINGIRGIGISVSDPDDDVWTIEAGIVVGKRIDGEAIKFLLEEKDKPEIREMVDNLVNSFEKVLENLEQDNMPVRRHRGR